jgi:hypothetical protein
MSNVKLIMVQLLWRAVATITCTEHEEPLRRQTITKRLMNRSPRFLSILRGAATESTNINIASCTGHRISYKGRPGDVETQKTSLSVLKMTRQASDDTGISHCCITQIIL